MQGRKSFSEILKSICEVDPHQEKDPILLDNDPSFLAWLYSQVSTTQEQGVQQNNSKVYKQMQSHFPLPEYIPPKPVYLKLNYEQEQAVVEMQHLGAIDLKLPTTQTRVRKAYRSLVKRFHPDRLIHLGPIHMQIGAERFIRLQEAYEVLKPLL